MQNAIWADMELSYNEFTDKMADLCAEGYFKAIRDGDVFHYVVLKKPQA